LINLIFQEEGIKILIERGVIIDGYELDIRLYYNETPENSLYLDIHGPSHFYINN
jgi:hypothetical protein